MSPMALFRGGPMLRAGVKGNKSSKSQREKINLILRGELVIKNYKTYNTDYNETKVLMNIIILTNLKDIV
jgi:hypothetical protein